MGTLQAQDIIQMYNLQPHPQGGYFRETYRSKDRVVKGSLPPGYEGARHYATAIYFLLDTETKSYLHRLKSDQIIHFYLGGPLTVIQLHPTQGYSKIVMGHNIPSGHHVQHVAEAGCWFGCYPSEGSEFSFTGCTVSPGFEYADVEFGEREPLIKEFPDAKESIVLLTRE